MQAIDGIKRFMERFNLGIHDGCVYRKPKEAKFTYVYCSSVFDFIHSILGNPEIADIIAGQVTNIIYLMSVPASRIVKPIIMDYNFIEVQPFGTCFNIEDKTFQVNPPTLKGISYSCCLECSAIGFSVFDINIFIFLVLHLRIASCLCSVSL